MMRMFMFGWLFLLLSNGATEQILVLLGSNPKYIIDPFWPLVTKLATRGHNITVLSSDTEYLRNSTNISIFELSGIKEYKRTRRSMSAGLFQFTELLKKEVKKLSDEFHNHDSVRRIMAEHPRFDVVLLDTTYDGYAFPFVRSLNAPIILLNSLDLKCLTAYTQEFPDPQSYEPTVTVSSFEQMALLQDWIKPLMVQSSILLGKEIERFEKEAVAEFYPTTPKISAIRRNVSLIFYYYDPVFNEPISLPLHVIGMTPFHIIKPQPLPKSIENFIQSSKGDGFILMSLESLQGSIDFPIKARDAFLQAFSYLPQTVLWEYYFDVGTVSSNVKVFRSLPQKDILGHSKLQLIITTGEEWIVKQAIYNGVPILGIPMTKEQQKTINHLKTKGFATSLNVNDLNEKIILQEINIILKGKFKATMSNYSASIKSESVLNFKRCVFWTEYISRHKNWRCPRPNDIPSKFFDNPFWKPVSFVFLALIVLLLSICTIPKS